MISSQRSSAFGDHRNRRDLHTGCRHGVDAFAILEWGNCASFRQREPGGSRMAQIFGVDEEIWSRALRDVLKKLETRQKERDRGGRPVPVVSAPAKPLNVRHTLASLDILAWLEGEPVERINMR